MYRQYVDAKIVALCSGFLWCVVLNLRGGLTDATVTWWGVRRITRRGYFLFFGIPLVGGMY